MPFTPFHFGPGLLLKSVIPRHCSWTAFAATQVVIDLETLYYMAQGAFVVHRTLHTFAGASVAGLVTAIVFIGSRPLLAGVFRRALGESGRASHFIESELSKTGLLVGGLLGGASHPLLDGIMHADASPLMPWSAENPLLGAIGLGMLHLWCAIAGVIGAAVIWVGLRRQEH